MLVAQKSSGAPLASRTSIEVAWRWSRRAWISQAAPSGAVARGGWRVIAVEPPPATMSRRRRVVMVLPAASRMVEVSPPAGNHACSEVGHGHRLVEREGPSEVGEGASNGRDGG